MLVGVPKEIKIHEYRVGLTPSSARELVHHGHQVAVETNAGGGTGFDDDSYRAVGAEVLGSAEEVFAAADMIVKVKEPQTSEYGLLRDGQVLYTYLHLAPDLPQTQGLIDSGCIAIAYETVTNARGGLPLLAPMSEVAGRMSVQVGAHCLEKEQGGSGMLLGGVPGVAAARVVIIGGGVSGTNAARMAMGMEAHVTVIDRSLEQLYALDLQFGPMLLDLQFGPMLNTIYSTVDSIETHVTGADLVIGAVLVPGAAAPKLVTRDMVRQMRPGSVLVDIAIDQGGCFETSKPTTHSEPTYVEEGCVHYCVTNMPGAVARTSTIGLNNATLPFGLALADKGYKQALRDNAHLRNGLNVAGGKVTYEAVADAHGIAYTPAGDVLGD
jgi:alanine dehydrogenase